MTACFSRVVDGRCGETAHRVFRDHRQASALFSYLHDVQLERLAGQTMKGHQQSLSVGIIADLQNHPLAGA